MNLRAAELFAPGNDSYYGLGDIGYAAVEHQGLEISDGRTSPTDYSEAALHEDADNLRTLGYDAPYVSNRYDASFMGVVRQFQQDVYPLAGTVDGIIGPNTRAAIQTRLAMRPSALPAPEEPPPSPAIIPTPFSPAPVAPSSPSAPGPSPSPSAPAAMIGKLPKWAIYGGAAALVGLVGLYLLSDA